MTSLTRVAPNSGLVSVSFARSSFRARHCFSVCQEPEYPLSDFLRPCCRAVAAEGPGRREECPPVPTAKCAVSCAVRIMAIFQISEPDYSGRQREGQNQPAWDSSDTGWSWFDGLDVHLQSGRQTVGARCRMTKRVSLTVQSVNSRPRLSVKWVPGVSWGRKAREQLLRTARCRR